VTGGYHAKEKMMVADTGTSDLPGHRVVDLVLSDFEPDERMSIRDAIHGLDGVCQAIYDIVASESVPFNEDASRRLANLASAARVLSGTLSNRV
jgi:hypothetical protein